MQIAINNLLKTFKICVRNENIIIEFKKKNLDNLIIFWQDFAQDKINC